MADAAEPKALHAPATAAAEPTGGGQAKARPELMVQLGHTNVVSSVFSPDELCVLTAAGDNKLCLWETATGIEVREFIGHTAPVYHAMFSADGRYVLSASSDKTARLWDAATGKEVRRFVGHKSSLLSASISRNGLYVVTTCEDKIIRLFDAKTGMQIKTVGDETDSYHLCQFSPDSRMTLTLGDGTTIRLRDVHTGAEVRHFTIDLPAPPDPEDSAYSLRSVEFSPDGRSLLIVTSNGVARIIDAVSGAELRRFEYERTERHLDSATFSPDGHRVLTGSGGTARLYELSGSDFQRIEIAHLAFGQINFTLGNHYLLRNSQLWDIASGKFVREFTGIGSNVDGLAFSPDSRTIFIVSGGSVQQWDSSVGKLVRLFHDNVVDPTKNRQGMPFGGLGTPNSIGVALVSPNGRYLLTSNSPYARQSDPVATLWDIATGNKLRTYGSETTDSEGKNGGRQGGFGQPNGAPPGGPARPNYGGGFGGTSRSTNNGPGRPTFGRANGTGQAPNGQVSNGQSQNGFAPTNRGVPPLTGNRVNFGFQQPPTVIWSSAFSSDGSRILLTLSNRTAVLFDTETGNRIGSMGHADAMIMGKATALISPDGQYVALVGQGTEIWSLYYDSDDDKHERPMLRSVGGMGNRGTSSGVAGPGTPAAGFLPDGHTIVVVGEDAVVRQYKNKDRRMPANERFEPSLEFGTPDYLYSVEFSPDGLFVVVEDSNHAVLWETTTGKQIRSFRPREYDDKSAVFTPDSKALLIRSPDGKMHLFDTETGVDIRTFETLGYGHFSPDGRLLVSLPSIKGWD